MNAQVVREIRISNGGEFRSLQVLSINGQFKLWEQESDPNCDSLILLADDSDQAIRDVYSDTEWEVVPAITFDFATDSESGTVELESWDAACKWLTNEVSDEAIDDGGYGWIENPETGERFTRGNE